MSALRPLRGGCQCGRNRYIISIPPDSISDAQVLFNTEPVHQIPLATPLAAFLRVPLAWYQSTTYAFFPDEAHNLIRRVYTHPTQQHSQRNFCGYCGTPLSYWSEEPLSESAYISLTLGSLLREDLRDLEDLGLLPDQGEEESDRGRDAGVGDAGTRQPDTASSGTTALRQSHGVPWFDSLVEGTPLGKLRRSQGVQRSEDGSLRVEWEVVDFSGEDEDMGDAGASVGAERPAKRKLDERDATAQ